jgi:hypothetical protein
VSHQSPVKHGRGNPEASTAAERHTLPGPPGPVPASAAPAGTGPVPPERNGTVMNHSRATGQQRRAEELVCWTCGERIRFLWYRLCLTLQALACAAGQMAEFPMGLPPPDSAPPDARCQERP